MELFDFAYCPSWDRKLSLLASIALPEVWGDAAAGQPLAILKSYIFHTFNKVYVEYSAAEEAEKIIFYTYPPTDRSAFSIPDFLIRATSPFSPLFSQTIPDKGKIGNCNRSLRHIRQQCLDTLCRVEPIISRTRHC